MAKSGWHLVVKPRQARDGLAWLSNAILASTVQCADVLATEFNGQFSFALQKLAIETAGSALEADSSGAIAAMVRIGEWENPLCIWLSRDIVLDMTEAVFGGDGAQAPCRPQREFSETERRIARYLVDQIATCFFAAGKAVAARGFKVERLETRLDTLGLQGDDTFIVATLAMDVLGRQGTIKLLVAAAEMARLLAAFGHHARSGLPAPDAAWSRQMEQQGLQVDIPMRVIIREQMTLSEMSLLGVGQVLKISATPETPVLLEAEGQGLYWCRLGQSGGHYTVKIDTAASRSRRGPPRR